MVVISYKEVNYLFAISKSLHDVWTQWSYIWPQKILRLSANKSTIERILP